MIILVAMVEAKYAICYKLYYVEHPLEYKGHNASIMCNMLYVTCYMLCAYAAEQVEHKGHMLLSIHQSQTPQLSWFGCM